MRLTDIYQCLCDETRLRILNLLSSGPLCGCHFQEILDLPQVKVSKHLGYLRERQLVEVHREQNWMVYSLQANPSPELRHNLRCLENCRDSEPAFQRDLDVLRKLLPEMRVPASDTGEKFSTGDPFRILFLCTGNSARSIIAEFLTRHLGAERFMPFSAGSDPRPEVHPLALLVLRKNFGIDPAGARSKSLEEFAGETFDFIITLCDKARESCPPWSGQPITAHWNFDDPAAFEGSPKNREAVFSMTAKNIEAHLRRFIALPLENLDRLRLEHKTRGIGFAGLTATSPSCHSFKVSPHKRRKTQKSLHT